MDRLADEQVVTFTENPYHQRAKLVHLTDHGCELLQEVRRRQARWGNQLAEGLPPHELWAAAALMETVRQRLEQPAEEEMRHV